MNTFSNWLKYLVYACILMKLVVASTPKMVIYWGQESDGSENALREYCMDDSYDVIVVAFVYLFPTASGSTYPGMNFANHCYKTFNKANPLLLDCSDSIGPDITYCQQQGKQILLSFGGGEGTYGFSSNAQGTAFATTVWNMFLGGTSSIRPFGTAVFDGVDLDIEQGTSTGYGAFIAELRSYFTAQSVKQYYISAAPQCPYPDFLGPGSGSPFTTSWFDYVWIQFYNNYCGLDAYPKEYNFNTWAAWASSSAVNPNMKLFIGAPASADAAGSGYVSLSTLETIASATQKAYPDVYGGVMLWDCSNSDNNNNFGVSVGKFLHSSSTPTPSPPSTPVTSAHAQVTSANSHVTTANSHVTTANSHVTTANSPVTTSKLHGTTTTTSAKSTSTHSSNSEPSSTSTSTSSETEPQTSFETITVPVASSTSSRYANIPSFAGILLLCSSSYLFLLWN